MEAERLIAIEAALADLSRLYPAALTFVALREAAEHELLPWLTQIGARLRSLRRKQALDESAVLEVATQIMGESARWHEALDNMRKAIPYQQALLALQTNDQDVLRSVIPTVLHGYSAITSPAALSFAFAMTRPRRRPGTSPFLSVDACAQQIQRAIESGIRPEPASGAWWERELQPLVCAVDPEQLGASVALRKQAHVDSLAVFAVADDATLRIFSPLVAGPFTVVLAAQPEDEWWDAYELSYCEFRATLARELEQHGHSVELLEPTGSAS